jgi:hypothetical protein
MERRNRLSNAVVKAIDRNVCSARSGVAYRFCLMSTVSWVAVELIVLSSKLIDTTSDCVHLVLAADADPAAVVSVIQPTAVVRRNVLLFNDLSLKVQVPVPFPGKEEKKH